MVNIYGFGINVVYRYEAEPSYLSFSKIAYWIGVLHQKVAPNILKRRLLHLEEKEIVLPDAALGVEFD